MNISTMLLGHLIPLADEYKLNDMRQVCQKIMAVTEGYDEFVLLYDEAEEQVRAIDCLINDLRREYAIAERNHEHDLREDRPNA
jgi:hypothetical protein